MSGNYDNEFTGRIVSVSSAPGVGNFKYALTVVVQDVATTDTKVFSTLSPVPYLSKTAAPGVYLRFSEGALVRFNYKTSGQYNNLNFNTIKPLEL